MTLIERRVLYAREALRLNPVPGREVPLELAEDLIHAEEEMRQAVYSNGEAGEALAAYHRFGAVRDRLREIDPELTMLLVMVAHGALDDRLEDLR